MKKTKRTLAVLLAAAALFALSACQKNETAPVSDTGAAQENAQAPSDTEAQDTSAGEEAQNTDHSADAVSAANPTEDRSGAPIQIPDTVERIAVMAPSMAETLINLGCAENIVAVDTQTQGYAYEQLSADLPAFDMMTPDTEKLAELKPDVIFISGISTTHGADPYADLKELGICVINIPSSESIQGVKDDIAFLASCVGKSAEAEKIIADMTAEIDQIAEIGQTITDKKTVYFEISADPYEYSCGSNTFINEMIELLGAENIFANEDGWISVAPENIISANPDVIITNVNYVEEPVNEILSREGWDGVTAIKNSAVYYVDNQSSSLPNENIVKALKEMAAAIYPDVYEK